MDKKFAYSKRVIKFEINGDLPAEEMLKLAKIGGLPESVVSDTFLITDKEGMILAKDKVVYDGSDNGMSFTFGG